jgi:hypothetical protein
MADSAPTTVKRQYKSNEKPYGHNADETADEKDATGRDYQNQCRNCQRRPEQGTELPQMQVEPHYEDGRDE